MRGFSLVELLMAIAACGVLIGVSIPLVLTYHPSAQVTAGAQYVRILLNQTRQLAMDQLVLPTDLTICNLFCSFLLSHFPVVPPGGPPTSAVVIGVAGCSLSRRGRRLRLRRHIALLFPRCNSPRILNSRPSTRSHPATPDGAFEG